MIEEEYYKISKNEKLPLRCPIIGKCERYAETVLYLTELDKYGKGRSIEDKLKSYGYLSNNYQQDKVNQIGEPFQFRKSKSTCSFSNACPEVSLFNNDPIFGFIPKKPIKSGFWDNFWKKDQFGEDKQFQIEEISHFSRCPEFSNYQYEKNSKSKLSSTKKRRTPISRKMRFEIFQRDGFTCQYCKRSKDEDGLKLEIDHIIPIAEGGKDEFGNLITSCQDCNQGKSNKVI